MRSTDAVRASILGFLFLLGATAPTWATNPPEPIPKSRVSTEPLPLVPIPDDPPPHEGAMISLPHTLEPPDLIRVEVLEALPGRPITGERLVRPDGFISLEFYGDIQVRGLTAEQAKVKIIRHLRAFLLDDVLGLFDYKEPEGRVEAKPGIFDVKPSDLPPPPATKPEEEPAKIPQVESPKKKTATRPYPQEYFNRRTVRAIAPKTSVVQLAGLKTPAQNPVPDPIPSPPPAKNVEIPLGDGFTITIQVRRGNQETEPKGGPQGEVGGIFDADRLERFEKGAKTAPQARNQPPDGEDDEMGSMKQTPIDPADSSMVYVDVTAYNSIFYYVLGDVAAPGRMPWTGKETVLDALQFAGGLIPIADRTNIKLNRPARGGKPARSYQINYDAIHEGDQPSNLQVFPGDRLIIGRLPRVNAETANKTPKPQAP